MKSIKIFGLILTCCGLIAMSACDDKKENNGGNHSVSVNFGNGAEKWSAVYAGGYDWEDGEISLFFCKFSETSQANGDLFPIIDAIVNTSGTTTFPYNGSSDFIYFEYFSEDYLDRAFTDMDDNPLGDWWADAGTVKISSYSNHRVSGTVNMTMYDAYDYWINENEDPATKTLTVSFDNVPVEKDSESSSVFKKTFEGLDHTYSFKNPRIDIRKVK